MQITLSVTTPAEQTTVDVTYGTLIACERKFGKPMPEQFATPSLELLAWLAWEQTRKNGTTVPPFDQWFPTLLNVEVVGNEDPPLDVTL